MMPSKLGGNLMLLAIVLAVFTVALACTCYVRLHSESEAMDYCNQMRRLQDLIECNNAKYSAENVATLKNAMKAREELVERSDGRLPVPCGP